MRHDTQTAGVDATTAEPRFPLAAEFCAGCVLGVLGKGTVFGTLTNPTVPWRAGPVLEDTTNEAGQREQGARRFLLGAGFKAEGLVATKQPLTLAVALHSPQGAVSIEFLS